MAVFYKPFIRLLCSCYFKLFVKLHYFYRKYIVYSLIYLLWSSLIIRNKVMFTDIVFVNRKNNLQLNSLRFLYRLRTNSVKRRVDETKMGDYT